MKIAFAVNKVELEIPSNATTVMAWSAAARGHTVYMAGVGDFYYMEDGHIGLRAVKGTGEPTKSTEEYLPYMLAKNAPREHITSHDLDVLFIRNNPTYDAKWAMVAPVAFAQMAASLGVLVLNDPQALWSNIDKLYFQNLPEPVRPAAIITRDVEQIRQFYKEHHQEIIIKPLMGSGGADVFLLRNDDLNLNQMVEVICRNGYAIAQEYIPEAKDGDIRLMMMNGSPLVKDGKYAAFKRVGKEGDVRNNLHSGGHTEKADITDNILETLALLTPMFKRDGIFLAGVDIAGTKLMEINIFSPGGLWSSGRYQGVNYGEAVIEAIERKLEYRKSNPALTNRELACMD